jgi:hypothetical protein
MQPDAHGGVADAIPAHGYAAPDCQRCLVGDLTQSRPMTS